MSAVTRGQRLYFSTVGALALWVGAWGTFAPAEVKRALPWLVPPLHARFLGAVYLSAALMLACGVAARRQAEVRVMTLLVTLWTGELMVLSLFHLGEFDAQHKPVWFWFGAYALYPVVGVWSLCVHGGLRSDASGPALEPIWIRCGLIAGGVVFLALAALLLAAPQAMARVWPWKIGPLLTQIYSAPFAAYGLCFWLLGRGRSWVEARIVVHGATLFAGLVLVASILHRGVFDSARTATWIWFAGFALVFAFLTALELRFTGGSRRT